MTRSKWYLETMCFVGTIFLCGCNGDDEASAENAKDDGVEQTLYSMEYRESRAAIETITTFSKDTYLLNTSKTKNYRTAKANDCVAKRSERIGDTVFITLDYGKGCQLENGATLAGKIKLRFETNPTKDGIIIVTVLEDVIYNAIAISGGASTIYTSDRETENFLFTTETDYAFNWQDDLQATESAEFIDETIFEFTLETFDFYNLKSGSGKTTFNNGTVFDFDIDIPLRTDFDCEYIVSGVLNLQQNGASSSTDYGDGLCDDKAELTDASGDVTVIQLEKIIQ